MRKEEIRQKTLALRDAIPESERLRRSHAICATIAEMELFRRARHILFYYPIRSEASLLSLMEGLLANAAPSNAARKTVYLPRLEGADFRALPVNDLDLLETGDFGIPQPSHMEGDFDGKIDLVLVPGIAFTKEGDRLGMGKGYYDRYLKKVCNLPKLGVAFSEQMTDYLPMEPHDQRLDGLIEG